MRYQAIGDVSMGSEYMVAATQTTWRIAIMTNLLHQVAFAMNLAGDLLVTFSSSDIR
jgi:hypothetical protein